MGRWALLIGALLLALTCDGAPTAAIETLVHQLRQGVRDVTAAKHPLMDLEGDDGEADGYEFKAEDRILSSAEPVSDASYHHDSVSFRLLRPNYSYESSGSQPLFAASNEETSAGSSLYSGRVVLSVQSSSIPSTLAAAGVQDQVDSMPAGLSGSDKSMDSTPDSSGLNKASSGNDLAPKISGGIASGLGFIGAGWLAFHLHKRSALIRELKDYPWYCDEDELRPFTNVELEKIKAFEAACNGGSSEISKLRGKKDLTSLLNDCGVQGILEEEIEGFGPGIGILSTEAKEKEKLTEFLTARKWSQQGAKIVCPLLDIRIYGKVLTEIGSLLEGKPGLQVSPLQTDSQSMKRAAAVCAAHLDRPRVAPLYSSEQLCHPMMALVRKAFSRNVDYGTIGRICFSLDDATKNNCILSNLKGTKSDFVRLKKDGRLAPLLKKYEKKKFEDFSEKDWFDFVGRVARVGLEENLYDKCPHLNRGRTRSDVLKVFYALSTLLVEEDAATSVLEVPQPGTDGYSKKMDEYMKEMEENKKKMDEYKKEKLFGLKYLEENCFKRDPETQVVLIKSLLHNFCPNLMLRKVDVAGTMWDKVSSIFKGKQRNI